MNHSSFVRSVCSLFALYFITCPNTFRQCSLLPALITGPLIFGTRDSWVLYGIHVLSSQTESTHCAQHSLTSWNKVCFIDAARFKRAQQPDRGLCLSPFCGLCKDLSKRGGSLPEPPKYKRCVWKGCWQNPCRHRCTYAEENFASLFSIPINNFPISP